MKQKIYFTFLTVQSTRILNSKTNQLELSQETVLKEQQATKLNKSKNQTEIKQIDMNEIYSFHFIQLVLSLFQKQVLVCDRYILFNK